MDNNDINIPPKQLAPNTGFLLSWVAASSDQHYKNTLESLNLHSHHVGILELVQAKQPVVQSRIGEQLGIFKPVMVTLINELEGWGFVERRPHPTDKRALEIHMLDGGINCLKQIRQLSDAATNQFFNGLSSAERVQFHDLLAKIANSQPSPNTKKA